MSKRTGRKEMTKSKQQVHCISRAAARAMAELEAVRPRTPEALHATVRALFGVDVPRRALLAGHDAPFDYLRHAFFEGEASEAEAGRGRAGGGQAGEVSVGDAVVWAGRGAGKTFLLALVTLLDMLFKPGIEVRLLAGTLEQSNRAYEHLLRLSAMPAIRPLRRGEPTQRGMRLINGSGVQLLAQTEASVRGHRVHKFRCDEAELISQRMWETAQLTLRSGRCGAVAVRGVAEAASTMQSHDGLMQRLTRRRSSRVFRWSILDVAGRCPQARSCDRCPIERDCGGLAKRASGFVPIEDVIASRGRVDERVWDAEMMCRRPAPHAEAVYALFDPRPGGLHVLPESAGGGESVLVAGAATGIRQKPADAHATWLFPPPPTGPARDDPWLWLAGIDFGMRDPFVMLWARHWPGRPGTRRLGAPPSDPSLGMLEVVDEYIMAGRTLLEHLWAIERRGWPKPAWIGVDCSGGARNSQTGVSDIRVMQQRGYLLRKRRSPTIAEGVALVRRRLEDGSLYISPRCRQLIDAMTRYHYDPRRPGEAPVKDGPDHACDALRYLVWNLERGRDVKVRGY